MEETGQKEKQSQKSGTAASAAEIKISFAAIFMALGLLLGGVISMRFFGVFGICVGMLFGMFVGCLIGSRIEQVILKKEEKKKGAAEASDEDAV